jgi:hypothetical protein
MQKANYDAEVGKRYGMLVLVEKVMAVMSGNSRQAFVCRCDCGAIKTVSTRHLVTGQVKSCGCYKSKSAKERGTKHGMSETSLYKTWLSMRGRCHRPTEQSYKDYGGRGISVCDEWRNDFQAFAAYVGVKPSQLHSLDRIDNNGNYEPGNVKWSTRVEQATNRRSSTAVEFNGQVKTLTEWSELTGINRYTISERIRSMGWSTEKALTTPVRSRLIKYDSQEKTMAQWGVLLGIKPDALAWRIKKWGIDKAMSFSKVPAGQWRIGHDQRAKR